MPRSTKHLDTCKWSCRELWGILQSLLPMIWTILALTPGVYASSLNFCNKKRLEHLLNIIRVSLILMTWIVLVPTLLNPPVIKHSFHECFHKTTPEKERGIHNRTAIQGCLLRTLQLLDNRFEIMPAQSSFPDSLNRNLCVINRGRRIFQNLVKCFCFILISTAILGFPRWSTAHV